MLARIEFVVVSLFGAAVLPIALGCEPAPPPEAAVRVVLVTIDTLRADRLDPLAVDAHWMPHTRAFAETGAWFTSFWAASSTTQPTHATLFTGLDPWAHGVPLNGAVLSDEHETLAERLQSAGFSTIALVGSFPLAPRFGFDQGFEVYDHDFDRSLHREWSGQRVDDGRFYRLGDAVTRRALDLLDGAAGSRQFYWIHYFDPHAPYGDLQPRPLELRQLIALQRHGSDSLEDALATARILYDRDLEHLDRSLAKLFARLERDAAEIETHVVITADHGESFGEHGALAHGERVTREQVQVPLIIVSPRVAPGVRRDVAGTRDLMKTLLSLSGMPETDLPGRDLTANFDRGKTTASGMSGVRTQSLDRDDSRRRRRYYYVEDDVLYAGDPRHVIEEDVPERRIEAGPLRDSLLSRFSEFAATLASRRVKERVDDETRAALKALGYAE